MRKIRRAHAVLWLSLLDHALQAHRTNMNILHRSLPALLLAPLFAQSAPNLIAVTLNSPLIVEFDHPSCTQLSLCGPIVLPPTLPPTPSYWPGGITWDAANAAAWVTTGSQLALIPPGTCAPICGPVPCPRSVGSLTTGLDLHEGTGEFWGIDDLGVITTFTVAPGCVTTVQNSWPTGLVATPVWATTGITVDELNGLVFYSTADFSVGSGSIYVAPIATPGAWVLASLTQECFAPVPSLITGLAVDAGNSVLYWTNGRNTFAWNYVVVGASVTFTPGPCCILAAPFTDPFTDLAIRWGGATSTGGPCANGSCTPCPMVHTLRNAPLLNTVLQLGLDQAQPGTLTLCGVSLGGCNPAGPIVPPFCGPLMVPLTTLLGVLGPAIPVGPGPCQASDTQSLPLFGPPALIGTVFSTQFVSLCAPSGTAMSNCLTWTVQ
jgi:hypothetical protein